MRRTMVLMHLTHLEAVKCEMRDQSRCWSIMRHVLTPPFRVKVAKDRDGGTGTAEMLLRGKQASHEYRRIRHEQTSEEARKAE